MRRFEHEAAQIQNEWRTEKRWGGIKRDYSAEEVVRIRGSLKLDHTLARLGAEYFWELLHTEDYVFTFGALSGSQATEIVKAGLKAIYVSGWQVAADANLSQQTYPDQSIYPVNSVPALVKRLNNALMRADQIEWSEKENVSRRWLVPLVADAEAGFGGPIHAFELTKALIEAGAAGVHFEDQLAAEKKCGHLGGKVLVPTSQFIRILNAARLAADVCGVRTVLIARTDALSASFLTTNIDEYDKQFITGERSTEGYYAVKNGIESAISRGLAYAPYADALWFETSTPSLEEAKDFAEAIHCQYPGKLLAYNLSPSFNWKKNVDSDTVAKFQRELAAMGYKFQFITLAGWHLLNLHTFQLARALDYDGMPAYVKLQEEEFEMESVGYTAARHQREVGTGYFDLIAKAVSGGNASTTALSGSTEAQQFH